MRKTWAPIGHTPRLRHSSRRDRVSVISVLTVAPRRRRLGLYFDLCMRNITGTEVITFLRQLLRHLRGKIALRWDGGEIHRRRNVQTFLQRHPRIEVHRFPSYAPELNPDEFIWTQAKRELANTDHDGLVPLTLHVVLRRLAGIPDRVASRRGRPSLVRGPRAGYTSDAMDVALFDYELPGELIAQEPAEPRDASRLLVLDRATGGLQDRAFSELPALLRPGDCLVANRSRVIPARVLGVGEGGRPVELLFLRPVGDERWEAMVRPGRRCRVGARIEVANGAARARVVGEGREGTRVVEIDGPWPLRELLERHGLPPLPPYIGRHDAPKPEDRERYQTVYAREEGSVAAPTAGLHFTRELLARLERGGIAIHYLTLHVGPGTFRPLRAERLEAHRMEPEPIEIPDATARAIDEAKREGRRVVAVGTTTTRALEWAAAADGRVRPGRGDADLFIRPGHRFRIVDALVTNFHLPRSSLLVLVSALAGREVVLDAYRHAVEARYRFYSYGDAMLIG